MSVPEAKQAKQEKTWFDTLPDNVLENIDEKLGFPVRYLFDPPENLSEELAYRLEKYLPKYVVEKGRRLTKKSVVMMHAFRTGDLETIKWLCEQGRLGLSITDGMDWNEDDSHPDLMFLIGIHKWKHIAYIGSLLSCCA